MRSDLVRDLNIECDDIIEKCKINNYNDMLGILIEKQSAIGHTNVIKIIPSLWSFEYLRSDLLTFLAINKNVDLYAQFAFEFLNQTTSNVINRDKLSQIAKNFLDFGKAQDFLQYIDFRQDFQRIIPIQHMRLLAASGRSSSALKMAREIDWRNDHAAAYVVGWMEYNYGDKILASEIRSQCEDKESAEIRRKLEILNSEFANGSVDFNNIDSFGKLVDLTQSPQSVHGEIIKYAYNIYREIERTHLQSIPALELNIERIEVLNVADASIDDKIKIKKAGLNIFILLLLSKGGEIIEIISQSQTEISRNLASLFKVCDEDYFYSYFGDNRRVGLHRSIDLHRSIASQDGLRAICPWTLQVCITRESYYFEGVIFYRFYSDREFWILSTKHLFRRSWFWAPTFDVLIGLSPISGWHVGKSNIKSVIRNFQKWFIDNEIEVKKYRSKQKVQAHIVGLQPNIGHHYHNELSGLYRLDINGMLKRNIKILAGPFDYYDSQKLFNVAENNIIKFEDDIGLSRSILNNNLFVSCPTDISAFSGLGRRVSTLASSMPQSTDLMMAMEHVSKSDCVIIIGLRTKQRVWVGGWTGVATLVKKLTYYCRTLFSVSKPVFIFDGYTSTNSKDDSEQIFITSERNIVNHICGYIDIGDTPNIVCSVGMNVYEKALLFSHASLAICPKGNGHLPTVAWISKTPAIIHSNSVDIGEAGWENSYCEDAPPISPIDRANIFDRISDLSVASRWQSAFGPFMQGDYILQTDTVLIKCLEILSIKFATRKITIL